MHALILFFIQLALLRRGPQDLPASAALVLVLAVLSVLVGAVGGIELFGGLAAALGANLLDLALSMTMLFVLLQFKGHSARWLQTAGAFLGLGVLAGVVMLVVRAMSGALGVAEITLLLDLVLIVWLHLALGSVLRHALEMPLLGGVAIVFAYSIMAFNLIARIFPPATVEL